MTDVNDVNDSPAASYRYDFAGRRIRKTEYSSQKTTRCVYDGEQVVAEFDVNSVSGTETLLRRFIYGPGIDEPVAMRRITGGVGKWFYYHYDGLGSVVAVSDSSGKVVEKYSYDVYGSVTIRDPLNAIRSSSAYGNPYLFTGREFDNETGNYYYRARYYHPQIGRFLSADPLGTVPDGWLGYMFEPAMQYEDGMNLYSYVGNNPVNWTDPWGLKCKRKPPEDRDCVKGCQKVFYSMTAPTGCAAKCHKKGSAGVSACIFAAKTGYEVCQGACLASDDTFDQRPPRIYKKARNAVYKACGG